MYHVYSEENKKETRERALVQIRKKESLGTFFFLSCHTTFLCASRFFSSFLPTIHSTLSVWQSSSIESRRGVGGRGG